MVHCTLFRSRRRSPSLAVLWIFDSRVVGAANMAPSPGPYSPHSAIYDGYSLPGPVPKLVSAALQLVDASVVVSRLNPPCHEIRPAAEHALDEDGATLLKEVGASNQRSIAVSLSRWFG